MTLTFAGQEERQRIQDKIENHNQELLKKPDRDNLKDSGQNGTGPEDQKIWSYPEIVYEIMTESFHKLIRALKKQYVITSYSIHYTKLYDTPSHDVRIWTMSHLYQDF